MLYLLFQLRQTVYSGLRLFQYITFRASFAAITAFLIGVALGPWLIRRLNALGVIEKPENPDAPSLDRFVKHKKVPTMGGILIVLSIVISTALWAKPTLYVFLGILTTAWLGMVGLIDDYVKLRGKRRGISKTQKLILQSLLAILLAVVLYNHMHELKWGTYLSVPFWSGPTVSLGFLLIPLAVIVVVGSSNAVNLTDGMDGLAGGCVLMASVAFAVIAYLTGHAGFAEYLRIAYIPEAGELVVFCSAIAGACLAFLWYNCYPAQMFMGDTGSLSLGGSLGYVAVVTRQEIGLFIIGGIFVVEALSVMIQVFYFRRTGGKRFFLMAPLHHHFQHKGIPETKVVVRFIIVAAILTAFAIATLKIR